MHFDIRIVFLTTLFMLNSTPLWANEQEDVAEDIISIYGTACENIKPEEAKSSVRVRATDKASFKAVENIPELNSYGKNTNAHDFNVIIYNVVDNFVEDLTVRTTEQTAEKICVEVTGYISSENILTALNNNVAKKQALEDEVPTQAPIMAKDIEQEEAAEYPDKLMIEDKTAEKKQAVTDFPPKPNIQINEAIAAENIIAAEANEQAQKQPTPQPQINTVADVSDKAKVHLLPTRFYNGMTTENYLPLIKEIVEEDGDLTVIAQAYDADYIIKSEVLRAKVDPINKQTNRLQMVVALSVENAATKEITTEHQNRFVLFENGEDEQKVANNLMKKLLKKASEQTLRHIGPNTRKQKSSKSIITPTDPKKNPEMME